MHSIAFIDEPESARNWDVVFCPIILVGDNMSIWHGCMCVGKHAVIKKINKLVLK